jgi:hypothetical protein
MRNALRQFHPARHDSGGRGGREHGRHLPFRFHRQRAGRGDSGDTLGKNLDGIRTARRAEHQSHRGCGNIISCRGAKSPVALLTRRVRLRGNPKWLLAFKRCFPSRCRSRRIGDNKERMNVRKLFWPLSSTHSWKRQTGRSCPARSQFRISNQTRCGFLPGRTIIGYEALSGECATLAILADMSARAEVSARVSVTLAD